MTRSSPLRPRPRSLWVETLRTVVRVLMRVFYKFEIKGLDNLPADGPALLIANHVSFIDSLVILAASPRHVRFVVDHRWTSNWFAGYFCRLDDAITIAPAREDSDTLEAAFLEIDEALEAGELVCIFPEGSLTKTGRMGQFRRGMERILKRRPVRVVPMALKGLWNSAFSRNDRRRVRDLPREFRQRVELRIGNTLRGNGLTADHARSVVASLLG